MRVRRCNSPWAVTGWRAASGLTLVELMVSVSVAMMLLAGACTYILFASRSLSAITDQTTITQQAGNALALIQSRIRLATMVSNDASGNILTIGFDTNAVVDSGRGGNAVSWANQDYFEQFKFIGVNSTNPAACRTNVLVYIPNTSSTNSRVLIPSGVRNLPGHNVFAVTNSVLVSICFGAVGVNPQNNYQGIDIQSMSASLNRPQVKNMLTILPPP